MTNTDVVAAQLSAYNDQDIDRFCACYAEDALLVSYDGAVLAEGLAAIRARHEALFSTHPENRAALLHRIAVGDFVIDHEDVTRGPAGERFQVAAIYTMRDGKIAKVAFAR